MTEELNKQNYIVLSETAGVDERPDALAHALFHTMEEAMEFCKGLANDTCSSEMKEVVIPMDDEEGTVYCYCLCHEDRSPIIWYHVGQCVGM